MNKQNAADFSQGSIGSRIMAQAIPLSLAEIVQLLYNIVDRIFFWGTCRMETRWR